MAKKATKGKGGDFSPPFLQFKSFYWGVLAFTLLLAYLQKTPCFSGSWSSPESVQYRKLCYSDLQALYGYRGLNEKKIPYVEQKPFEYPPLIGYQMYLAALFSADHVQFFKVNAFINSLWALLTLLALIGIVGYTPKLLWFALVTPLVFHLHLNWDISSVACISLAMLFWKREKFFLTGLFIGIGFTGKMFPVFVLPFMALAIYQTYEDYKHVLLKGVAGTLTGVFLMNLPIVILDLVLNKDGTAVLGVFGFHAARTPDFGTAWYWLAEYFGWGPTTHEYTQTVDRLFLMAMAGSAVLLLWKQWKGKAKIWQSAAIMTAVCLAFSKVHSPQYSLWLLPFLVVLPGSIKPKLFYFLGDALVFAFGFWWFAEKPDLGPHLYRTVFSIAVFTRATGLLWLAANWARAKD